MQKGEFAALADIYREELFGNILPFWMKNGIDQESGGFFTCFSNDGARLLHKHKFTWSQGRFIWMLSRLYDVYKSRLPKDPVDRYLSVAKDGVDFLIKHARLPDGACAFILSEKGAPILLNPDGTAREKKAGEFYDLSIYGDLFALYGVGEYARVSGEKHAFAWAKDLCKSIAARFDSGRFHSWPYPVPAGYKPHGLYMGHEMYQEFAETAKKFGDTALAEDLMQRSDACIHETLTHFLQPNRLVLEFIGADNKPRDNMLGTYINPGHTLEDLWFMMHFALKTGRKAIFKQVAPVILKTLEAGWDREFDGDRKSVV
jgi:N-acylglucosamine 2-epimerase